MYEYVTTQTLSSNIVPWTRKRSGQEQEILMFAPNWRMVFLIFLYCKVALYYELGFWKKCVCDLFSKRKNTSKILCWGGRHECVITGVNFSHFLMRFWGNGSSQPGVLMSYYVLCFEMKGQSWEQMPVILPTQRKVMFLFLDM